ncbi:winged helix-turn-helix transcriptional regulator, partial [Candidatus Woesearchaeota archaeon]|nr:winged helix-turn-helix transcriptional regulator [Candidatus Woesearchaeota archaeon]
MEETVTIVDRNILKVLAGETRMDILKELSKGSRTPSDLGKMLGKMDSTIVEHLEALMKVGLVKKIEQPGKKWVFYTLTEKGDAILSKKSRNLVIIL